ncbi:MAG: hypothetical protein WCN85_06050, partial [Burkholderiales bacterium]
MTALASECVPELAAEIDRVFDAAAVDAEPSLPASHAATATLIASAAAVLAACGGAGSDVAAL